MINKDIPVFILCGGLGTRLKEETEFRPKPMVPVGDKPILWHIMNSCFQYSEISIRSETEAWDSLADNYSDKYSKRD